MTASLLFAAAIAAQPAGSSAEPGMTHKVVATTAELGLSPASRVLTAKAKLRLKPKDMQSQAAGTAVFALDPAFAVSRVTLDEKLPGKFTRQGGVLVVPLPKVARPGNGWLVSVEYAGKLPNAPGGLRLGPEGAVLPAGDAAWLPKPVDAPFKAPLTVTVRAPKAWRAVGPAARSTVEPGRQAVRLDFAGEPAVVAGPYKVFSAGGTTFYVLGEPPADAGAANAVQAFYKARGLQLGAPGKKDGPAPTLVELPAGDQPIVTRGWVAGSRPPGGLGAWLASQAWLPADERVARGRERRWLVESLAAYTEELAQGAEPRLARDRAMREHLQAYQAFLRERPAHDRPLDAAIGPADPAWDPVVRDKGALVWDMVREALGDEAFWALLRRHQAALRAGGGDFQAFTAAAGRRLDWLGGWLRGPGLPEVKLADVKITGGEGRWQVAGALAQGPGTFSFPVDLALVTEAGVEKVAFTTFAPRVPFHFVATSRPLRLVLDGADRAPVVRRPHLAIPEGVAPAGGVIVYGTQGDERDNQASREAAEALQARLKRFKDVEVPVRADRELTAEERGRSLVLMGRPGVNGVATELADQFPVRFVRGQAPDGSEVAAVDGKAMWWQGRTYTQPDHGVVQVIANPEAPEQVVLLFAGLSPRAQADALRYTQRGATFCVFAGDQVVAEGDALRPFPDLDVVLY